MSLITFDDRSLIIDGQRIWLVSGQMDYFRMPSALWGDMLLKARRGGLNCIATCVAWNVHEMREGQWDFTGDRDVAAFVDLAHQMGLYVILRPGPYIGDRWDNGGLPAWLGAKTGISYRASNAVYTHYFDKYFRQILPRLAPLQVTRGGAIVLVQNENDYRVTNTPDRLAYLEFVNQLIRRGGFDVPIIASNGLSDPPLPEAIECVSGGDTILPHVQQLRSRQPAKPLLVSDYCCSGIEVWGGPTACREGSEVARRAMELLGLGAQVNYSPWHGGTNFGFWASAGATGQGHFHTTAAASDAPLTEDGRMTEKYYQTRLVNLTARHMRQFIAESAAARGAVLHNDPAALNLSGPLGRLIVVTRGARSGIAETDVALPGGKTVHVNLQPLGAVLLAADLRLNDRCTLNYANLAVLGLFGQNLLVLHGPAGWPAEICLNGSVVKLTVPSGDEPLMQEHSTLHLAVVNSDVAMRLWPVGEELLLGPLFVGATPDEATLAPGARQMTVLSFDGHVTFRKIKPPAPKPPTPRLSPWKRTGGCPEPHNPQSLAWQNLSHPTDVDRLGAHYGYVWYRLKLKQDRARKRMLYLPRCADRASLYLNGQRIGVFGDGGGAARQPMPATLRGGENTIVFLADNMGRFCAGSRLGEPKGIWGPLYDARPIKPSKSELTAFHDFSPRMAPRTMSHLTRELQSCPVWALNLTVSLSKVIPLQVAFENVPHHAAIMCNGRVIEFFENVAGNWGRVTLGPELKRGKNVLTLLLWSESAPDVANQVHLYALQEELAGSWSWRSWDQPAEDGGKAARHQPAWFVSTFKAASQAQSLFLRMAPGSHKGQLFLNGHNLGRFWGIGPQHRYFLPSCWLKDVNELLMFEEQGLAPATTLEQP